jgi:LacI family transcriptional regulator
MGKKITINSIAKDLGVSKSTISRAMNNLPGVGTDLRKQINDHIAEVGYSPNAVARGLSKGALKIVALILSDIRNPYYSDLAFYIQRLLIEQGYMLVVFNSENNLNKEIEFIDTIVNSNFAGLILLTARKNAMSDELKNEKIPVVLVNRMLDIYNYKGDSVILDNFKAGYIATMHLIELGFPRIAYIKGNIESSASIQRYKGYLQALQNYKILFFPEDVLETDLKLNTGYTLAKSYIKNLKSKPKAIVIGNDLTAIGFIECCRENSVKIPEDISVIGFDNIIFSSLYDINLTTVDQHVKQMSAETVKLILKQIDNPDATPERIILNPELIVRKTTCRYKK